MLNVYIGKDTHLALPFSYFKDCITYFLNSPITWVIVSPFLNQINHLYSHSDLALVVSEIMDPYRCPHPYP